MLALFHLLTLYFVVMSVALSGDFVLGISLSVNLLKFFASQDGVHQTKQEKMETTTEEQQLLMQREDLRYVTMKRNVELKVTLPFVALEQFSFKCFSLETVFKE